MGKGARQTSDNLAWDRSDEIWEESMKQVRLRPTCQKIEALAQRVLKVSRGKMSRWKDCIED
ncbi:hypothetical protein V8F06_014571 [Rhypophila decipiens]